MIEKKVRTQLWVISFLNTDSVSRVSEWNPYRGAATDTAQGLHPQTQLECIERWCTKKERPFGEIKSHVPQPPKQEH